MNSCPSPYLKVTRLTSIQRGTSSTSSCSTFTHSTGTDSLGKVEGFRLAERCGGEPAAVLLVDDRRVEALLDGRPDGERRREVIAGNGQVSPVPDADLIDLAEQVVGGVPSEHIGKAGLDAHPDQSDLA